MITSIHRPLAATQVNGHPFSCHLPKQGDMSVQRPSQIRARGPGRDICYRPSSNSLPCPSSIHYLLWVLRLLFTWPWPVQPGVGHFSTFSCMAKTVREPGRTNNENRHDCNREQLKEGAEVLCEDCSCLSRAQSGMPFPLGPCLP